MLVVPLGQDQPENSRRCVTLGVGRTLAVKNYTVARVTEEISALLAGNKYCDRAEEIGKTVQTEHGTETACNQIGEVWRRRVNQSPSTIA